MTTSARNSTKIQKAKCVVVGDESCGKSALIVTYTTNCFPTTEDTYSPFDKTSVHVQLPHSSDIMNLEIWEAAAADSYSKLRAISYSSCDLFILCFSIASPPTFENIFRRWYLELAQICPHVPLVLVGCKSDLRNNSTTISTLATHGLKPITTHQGRRMAEQISARNYIECSSLSSSNLSEVFVECCRIINLDRQLPKDYLTKSLPTTTKFGSIKLSKSMKLPLDEVMASKQELEGTSSSNAPHSGGSRRGRQRQQQQRKKKKKRHMSLRVGKVDEEEERSETEPIPRFSTGRKMDSCIIC